MNKKLRISLMMAALLLIGLLSACGTSEDKSEGGNSSDKKVLTMGTSADYPPFEYVETAKSNEIIGFDIDLAKALAKKLGYEVEVKDIDFNGLVPALENKTVDFVLAGMSPTPEREKTVDFSDIYYLAHNTIMTKDPSIKTVDDLSGKKVGVQLTSIQETLANDLKKDGLDITVEKRNRIPDLVQEMNSGRIDAVVIEDLVAKGYLEDDKDLSGFVIKEDGEKGSAIAFQKGSDLTDKFNKELAEFKDSGEMDKLVLKWFGGEEK